MYCSLFSKYTFFPLLQKPKTQIQKTVTVFLVWHCRDIWSVTQCEEDRLYLRMGSEGYNGHTITKVTTERRKLHEDELYDRHSSPDIIGLIKLRMMKRLGGVSRM